MDKNKYILLFEKYLRNETSAEEEQLLLMMIRRDKGIDDFFEKKIESSNQIIDNGTERLMFENINLRKTKKINNLTIKVQLRKIMQLVAMIMLPVLSALIVYFLTYNSSSGNFVTVTAPKGEKANIILSDSSIVWINSGSSLTYDKHFNRKERRVYLEGEAYFEIAKDTKRPFIVQTHEMDIEALGTAFNVRSYNEENKVSAVLLEGRIKVKTQNQQRILSENERVFIDKSTNLFSTDRVVANDYIQWKDGNLYFENSSFEEIAVTLSRVFNVEIRFASERLRSICFTGTLSNSSIRNALDILSLTSSMHYEMNGTVVELYYKD